MRNFPTYESGKVLGFSEETTFSLSPKRGQSSVSKDNGERGGERMRLQRKDR